MTNEKKTKKEERKELEIKLLELSDCFKVQTQKEYSKGTLAKRIEEEAFPLAYNLGEHTFKSISTIWNSCRIASKEMVSLSLEMFANELFFITQIEERQEKIDSLEASIAKQIQRGSWSIA